MHNFSNTYYIDKQRFNTLLRLDYIDRYFGALSAGDWTKYLVSFVEEKVNYEASKGNDDLLKKYKELQYET